MQVTSRESKLEVGEDYMAQPQWHISFSKTALGEPSQSVPPSANHLLKYEREKRTFSFKPSNWAEHSKNKWQAGHSLVNSMLAKPRSISSLFLNFFCIIRELHCAFTCLFLIRERAHKKGERGRGRPASGDKSNRREERGKREGEEQTRERKGKRMYIYFLHFIQPFSCKFS